MTTIVEFLTARLDEDEALAGIATPGPWRVETAPHRTNVVVPAEGLDRVGTTGRRLDMPPIFTGQTASISRAQWEADAQHIARHDPVRVLREVEAKRRTLARHSPILTYGSMACDGCGWDREDGHHVEDINECPELRDMASVYAEHPDFDPAWAVDVGE